MTFLDIIPGDVLQEPQKFVSTMDRLVDKLIDYSITLGLKLVAATIVFFIGRFVITWLRRLIQGFLERRNIESSVKSFVDSLSDIMLKIVLFLVIANILGLSLTSFAAILAAAGLAIGMAMKDNLSNFAGGLLLLINKPFKVGDRILAQGMDGVVDSIGILYTVLLTGDNRTIFIPNGPLSTGSITNYSAQDKRRIDITLNIYDGVSIKLIKETLKSITDTNKKIHQSPEPFIGITTLNNNTMDVALRVWVDTPDYLLVNTDLNERIYTAFCDKQIFSAPFTTIRMAKEPQ